MSIVAVTGIPIKWNLTNTINALTKVIKGSFEGLNFGGGKISTKTLYLRLADNLDPVRVIENICRGTFPQNVKLKAHVPNVMPDIPLANRKRVRRKILSKRVKFDMEPPYQVIQRTHHEVLMEIQYKYPGLYNLSRKTGHLLLNKIAKVLFERLKEIMSAHVETRENCFKLSSFYRKSYPHFGDFQLILSTLHTLQDVSGAPHAHIQEKELLQPVMKTNTIENYPSETVKAVYTKYSENILKTMTAHIKSLDSNISNEDTEEIVARKKVREELKKILPYMPSVVRQVVTKNFTPKPIPMHRIRIYGEPFLPSKDAMSPFVRRYHAGASRIIRHPRMYNLLLFKIPQNQYVQLMAMDGTVVTGAKLVIRGDGPTYEASYELKSEMSAALGGPRHAPVVTIEEEDEDYDLGMEEM